MTEGTAKRSAEQIANEASLLGTDLSSTGTTDSASLRMSLLSNHLGQGMELMADSLEHPSFPATDLETDSRQPPDALLQQQDNPVQLALRAGESELVRSVEPLWLRRIGHCRLAAQHHAR